jgi:hypothetical protein
MEERISPFITTGNTDDKRISTYALCIALLALISFVNFFILTFVSVPKPIYEVLTTFDFSIALILSAPQRDGRICGRGAGWIC